MILGYAPLGDLLTYVTDHSGLGHQESSGLFGQICAGIFFLHARRVVHRDIKPDNILLKQEANLLVPMLADFGLARFYHNGCYSYVGTPHYLAPEIWLRREYDSRNGPYDEKVDMWSAGVTLFAMLKNETPFYDDDDLERQVCEGDFRFKELFEVEHVLDLHCVLCCLLVTDPAVRLSAEDVIAAINVDGDCQW